ncbi:MAG TPA: peptide-methionine (R)-S-oxide reductase [Acidobacteriaceae bacterium]|jgi:peptide-methionine (R)-S-oxide reductase
MAQLLAADREGKCIRENGDLSMGMARTKVKCRQFEAHLGHIFDDGPKPLHEVRCRGGLSNRVSTGG